MGAVYRAHHILMDKPVAVKVLRQELASDTEAVARFHREARSASRLDHENIIRVSDFGQTDDGLLFLVMELLDGENLAQALRRGPLPWRRAATIARDVALGLAARPRAGRHPPRPQAREHLARAAGQVAAGRWSRCSTSGWPS